MDLIRYLAWWAKWRIRGLMAADDAARLRMMDEAERELRVVLGWMPDDEDEAA